MSSRVFVKPDMEKYLFKGEVRYTQAIDQHLKMMRSIFCKQKGKVPAEEIYYLFIGERTDTGILVTELIDISGQRQESQVIISLVDVERVATEKWIMGTYHVHPVGSLEPSRADFLSSVAESAIAGHPLIHIIEDPDGGKLTWDFSQCFTSLFYRMMKDAG